MQRKTLQADKSSRVECLPRQNCVVYFKRRSGYHSEHTISVEGEEAKLTQFLLVIKIELPRYKTSSFTL